MFLYEIYKTILKNRGKCPQNVHMHNFSMNGLLKYRVNYHLSEDTN